MFPYCGPTDFTFIVDTSSSLCQTYNRDGTCEEFIQLKEFMNYIVRELGDESVQTALINFATQAEVSIRVSILARFYSYKNLFFIPALSPF
jgi:hypothetical protein